MTNKQTFKSFGDLQEAMTQAQTTPQSDNNPTEVPLREEADTAIAPTDPVAGLNQAGDNFPDESPAAVHMRLLMEGAIKEITMQTRTIGDQLITEFSKASAAAHEALGSVTEEYRSKISGELDGLIKARMMFESNNESFDDINKRIDDVNARLDSMEHKAPEPELSKYDRVLNRIKQFGDGTGTTIMAVASVVLAVGAAKDLHKHFTK